MPDAALDAASLLRERANRFGPIGFDEFVDVALYAPGAGFYETGGTAGRGGDFLTSPEIGPLFGAVVAGALDTWWAELGRPDPFVVIEAAAGRGVLCRSVLDAAPACLPALRYLMVERSDALRDAQAALVPVEPSFNVLGPVAPADEEDDEGARVLPGHGPRIASLAELPAGPLRGVVFANELLDNLPFALAEWDGGQWLDVRVDGDGNEVLVAAPPSVVADAERYAGTAASVVGAGARIPLQAAAAAWLRDALAVLERGRVVVVDYAATTAELAGRPWLEWVRTYRRGGRGSPPLERPGEQDITCEVCVDQLAARVSAPSLDRTQADFLVAHGIADLVDAARAQWQATATGGGLDSLRARSRITVADALLDPTGLGGFRVLESVLP